MNLKDLYIQEDVQKLLQMLHRMQVYRWRKNNNIRWWIIGNRCFYLRQQVQSYAETLIMNGVMDRFQYEDTRRRIHLPDLDLEEWLPLEEALKKEWQQSYELLYKISIRNPFPLVETKEEYGITFFKRKDIKRENEKR